jgi:hypothetical protein
MGGWPTVAILTGRKVAAGATYLPLGQFTCCLPLSETRMSGWDLRNYRRDWLTESAAKKQGDIPRLNSMNLSL